MEVFKDCGTINAIDDSENHEIGVPGIENCEMGVSEDEASSDTESEFDDSEDEVHIDESDADKYEQ